MASTTEENDGNKPSRLKRAIGWARTTGEIAGVATGLGGPSLPPPVRHVPPPPNHSVIQRQVQAPAETMREYTIERSVEELSTVQEQQYERWREQAIATPSRPEQAEHRPPPERDDRSR